MSRTFQIKRGLKAKLPTLAQGEFGLTTDSGKEALHIGTGTENLPIARNDKTVTMVNRKEIPNATNMDTMKTPGAWKASTLLLVESLTNLPEELKRDAFLLDIFEVSDAGGVVQRITPILKACTASRYWNLTSWTEWDVTYSEGRGTDLNILKALATLGLKIPGSEAHSLVRKNANASNDFGTNVIDAVDADDYTRLVISHKNGTFALERVVSGALVSSDDIYHKGNKPTTDDIGAVPSSRTVNGKALTNDISLTAEDTKSRPNTWTPSAEDVGAVKNVTYNIPAGGVASFGFGWGTTFAIVSMRCWTNSEYGAFAFSGYHSGGSALSNIECISGNRMENISLSVNDTSTTDSGHGFTIKNNSGVPVCVAMAVLFGIKPIIEATEENAVELRSFPEFTNEARTILGAAPALYGLGETTPRIAASNSVENIDVSGWWTFWIETQEGNSPARGFHSGVVTCDSRFGTVGVDVIALDGKKGRVKTNSLGGWGPWFSYLTTINKARGQYTGNGSATQRTINTGSLGNVCVVTSNNGIMALVTDAGMFYASANNAIQYRGMDNAYFDNGVLYLKTASYINASGTVFTYQVL